jgi:hypothetical protein
MLVKDITRGIKKRFKVILHDRASGITSLSKRHMTVTAGDSG